MSPFQLILLFLSGMAAAFINVIAGGGSALTLPVLIFMGMDSTVANGTNRIGIAVQTLFSIWAFRKDKIIDFKESSRMALYTLPGAIFGSFLSIRIEDDLFEKILGLIMVGIVFSMFLSVPSGSRTSSKNRRWLIYPAMLGIGFYGGFIQVGVGFLFMASLYHILRIDLVQVNIHKVFIILVYTLPAICVFALTGHIAWMPGLVLAGGMAVGGWYGAKMTVRGGEKVTRAVLIVAILIMAVKLLGLF